jgi:triosephosphate isomerase
MRQKSILLAGNWKMNYGPKEARAFLTALAPALKSNAPNATKSMRLYVPTVTLASALQCVKEHQLPLEIGSQNVHFEKSGAFTGETSAAMLLEIGIHQALVGHSERRQYFGDTNETVLKRTASALTQGLEVLVCIGETLNERNAHQTENVLREQLTSILQDATCVAALGTKLHIAYEPVWAIGTGVTASPEQAESAHAFIRAMLPLESSEKTKLLYGGSVTPANFRELLNCPNIDGGLVGGASLKVENWAQLWNLI